MSLLRSILLQICIVGILTGCGTSSQQTERSLVAPPADNTDPSVICEHANTFSVRDKIAQLLMVGVRDTEDAHQVVSTYHVGGIFIGSWTDLSILDKKSLESITNSSGELPLAISVDEEGGRVSRLSKLIGTSPSARQLARKYTVEQVHQWALLRGQRMKELGITIDFTPVVDIVSPHTQDDDVIGDRSFGTDPKVVTAYAGAYAQGLRDAGILPVLKHFPGHGHAIGDSHLAGLVRTPPLSQLKTNDLVPYQQLLSYNPTAVMVGHLAVPGLTDEEPASLSKEAIQLLRQGKGYDAPAFNGVIFTDDLSGMAAINQHYSIAEAVLQSLQAGVDMALWITTDDVKLVLDRLEQAYQSGELTDKTITTALHRIIMMKLPGALCH